MKFECHDNLQYSLFRLAGAHALLKVAMENVPVKYVIADLDGTLLDTGMRRGLRKMRQVLLFHPQPAHKPRLLAAVP
jgi:hypothetical protein